MLKTGSNIKPSSNGMRPNATRRPVGFEADRLAGLRAIVVGNTSGRIDNFTLEASQRARRAAVEEFGDEPTLADYFQAYIEAHGIKTAPGWASMLEAAGHSIVQEFGQTITDGILATYRGTPNPYEPIISRSEAVNTRAQFRYRRQLGAKLEKTARGKSSPFVGVDIGPGEQLKPERYGHHTFIDEQDQADLGAAFTDFTAQAGRDASNLQQDLIASVILGNPAMQDGDPLFHANHGNVNAAAAFDEAAADAGRAAMRTQQENGVFVGSDAGVLLVPEALLGKARRYAQAVRLEDGRDLVVISDPRLDIGLTDPFSGDLIAGDPTAWFLFSTTNKAIDVAAYTPVPQVSTWVNNGEGGKWGIGIAVHWIIAAAAVDFRGARRHVAP